MMRRRRRVSCCFVFIFFLLCFLHALILCFMFIFIGATECAVVLWRLADGRIMPWKDRVLLKVGADEKWVVHCICGGGVGSGSG